MNIKAVIFDLDGVIVHTDRYHYHAWKSVSEKLDLEFDEEVNNLLRGVSRNESLEIILRHNNVTLSAAEKDAITDEKNEIYKKYLLNMSESDLDADVLKTLKILKQNRIKIAIGSSSRNAPLILRQIGIYNLFDAISDGNNITNSKPDPEVFLRAASFLNLSPDKCIVVEDAVAGIDAAVNGGFISAGIGEAAKYPKCDLTIGSVIDILDFMSLKAVSL